MFKNTATRVGDEEGRRGNNTEELNQDQTLDQDQSQSLDQIPTDIPPILLPDPHFHHCLVQLHAGVTHWTTEHIQIIITSTQKADNVIPNSGTVIGET